MKKNKQHFYLVSHEEKGRLFNDKIFLQEYAAVKWGRAFATKNPEYSVYLYKQEITHTGIIKFDRILIPFLTRESALELASKYHLEAEVKEAMDNGMSPFEACKEWDVI